MGLYLALAIAVTINNVFLLFFLAFGFFTLNNASITFRLTQGLMMGLGALFIGLPIFFQPT